jgi:hypothetical protein
MDIAEEQELIERLVALTTKGSLIWQDVSTPFSNNAFRTQCEGVELQTEWLQDDGPMLFVNGVLALERNYKMDSLMRLLIDKFRKPIEISVTTEYKKEAQQKSKDQVALALEALKGDDSQDPRCKSGQHDLKTVACEQSNEKFVCQRPNCSYYFWD